MVATREAYNNAILNPSRNLSISDMDIRNGHVEKIKVKTSVKAYEIPWGVEGGFAVVYKFRAQSGQFKALRCFRVAMKDDIKYRYEQIGAYFRQHLPSVTAGFAYYDTGISVREKVGTSEQEVQRPLIVMDWIEGVTLLQKVDKLCQQGQRDELRQLAERWVALLNAMRKSKMAHGDLSGENVMVKNDGSLVLIDYDGVYIPPFHSLPPAVGGQGEYQHPEMKQRPFNEHMDAFSAYVIYIALLALHHHPDLWKTYAPRSPQGKLLGTHLLFTKNDFLNPANSRLFADLQRISDPGLTKALTDLEQACRQPIGQMHLRPLGDPDKDAKEALKRLEQAIQEGAVERIVQTWVPVLHAYPPAQKYKNEVQAAELHLQQLQPFLAAIQSRRIQAIADAYQALPPYIVGAITKEQREIAALATDFARAFRAQDEEALLKSSEAIEYSLYGKTAFAFTTQEEQRVQDARQRFSVREQALQDFRLALYKGNIEGIVKSYDPAMLDSHKDIDQRERDRLELARRFLTAYQKGDDQALLAVYDDMGLKQLRSSFRFTVQERQRLEQAQKSAEALNQLQGALATRKIALIANAYDPVLDKSQRVKQEERELVQLAKDFALALMNNDDEALSKAWDAIQQSPHKASFVLTPQEKKRTELMQQRLAALVPLRQALQKRNLQKIVEAYDNALDNSKQITPTEREIIRLAQEFAHAEFTDDDTKLLEVYEKVQSRHQNAFDLSTYQPRITLAQQRQQALDTFRKAVYRGKNRAQEIVSAYDPILDGSKSLTQQERHRLEVARNFLAMYKAVFSALAANNGAGNDDEVAKAYDEELAAQFTDFTPEQKQHISLIMNRYLLDYAIQRNIPRMIIQYATAVQNQTRAWLAESQRQVVSAAKRQFIKQFRPRNVQVTVRNGRAYASWEWPEDDLIDCALVEWRTDKVPQQPGEPGSKSELAYRSSYEQRGRVFEFNIRPYTQIYLRVYLAIPDHVYAGNTAWLYSEGDGPNQPIFQTSP